MNKSIWNDSINNNLFYQKHIVLNIGVARIFDWGVGVANQKSHAMRSTKIFERGTCYGTMMS